MPADAEIDELLSALEDSGDQETEASEDKPKGNPVRDLRKFADTVLREKKQTDAQNLKLQEELQQYRAKEESDVFTQLGLDEKKQKLFKSVNPEAQVTAETVQQFVAEYGITLATEDGDGEVETPPAQPNVAPTAPFAPAPMTGNAPDSQTYTSQQIIDLIMSGQSEQAHAIVQRAARQPSMISFKHADKMPQ
jgi:hypothetical protein